MLSNIIKVAALGLVGIGAKKLYEQFKKEEALPIENVIKDLPLDHKENLANTDSGKDCTNGEALQETEARKNTEDPMMRLIKNATTESLDQAHFYNHLKSHLPEAAQNWNDEQKNEFVRAVLSQGKRLALILKEVARIQNRLKHPIYDKNQTPSVQFKDIRLKLAIIQQLMAREELKPIFYYKLFVEEFTHFVDVRLPSSEAGEYMLNLDITQYQLNQIKDLYLDHYSGSFSFLHLPGEVTGEICGYKPYPQYRPADVVPMTTNVIDDLALLPNLKSISLPKDKPFEILDIRQTGLVKHLDGTYLGAGQGIQIDKLIVPRVFLEALNEKGIALYHGSKKLDIAAILNGESA